MIITLDYNNDSISLGDAGEPNPNIRFNKVKDMKFTQQLLEEIFNGISAGDSGELYVLLQSINEDHQKVIGEW